ncbi:MAG: hypothetical protein PHQ50_04845 [Eubacteriales bacterium]|nr:hypothetical protein [Eubacteriales bacterium]
MFRKAARQFFHMPSQHCAMRGDFAAVGVSIFLETASVATAQSRPFPFLINTFFADSRRTKNNGNDFYVFPAANFRAATTNILFQSRQATFRGILSVLSKSVAIPSRRLCSFAFLSERKAPIPLAG